MVAGPCSILTNLLAAGTLGFVAPPLAFFPFLLVATLTYLALVEVVKQRFYRRYAV
jgi:uncharacterized membrane protein YbaN (DUF454 family)